MIELNLLPDVKLEYIKAQRMRRLVFSVALLVTAASIVLLLLLLSLDGLQKKHLSDLNRDIANETSELKHKPNINRILTVQNQLESITTLDSGKPAATRIFNYLSGLTPVSVSIDNFTLDFTKQSISIVGSSDSLSSINQYVDTLKAATYTTGGNSGSKPAFSDVVLSNFSINSGASNRGQSTNYTVTLSYDPTIFDNTQKNITMSVSNQVTTRSAQQQPTDLFQAPAQSSTNSGGSH